MIYESDTRIVQEKLDRLYRKATISQYRRITWGGLMTLAWICMMTRLPPIQQSRSILPHLVMYGLAYSLAKTVGEGLKKTQNTKQSIQVLSKQLKQIHSDQEYKKIYQTVIALQRQYPD
ncbi:MAG: hypothetical protein IJV07_02525 [Alphaproteobacteria bacterium]|nr:hypothetical protein [Alphaproteobacteria bacterium]